MVATADIRRITTDFASRLSAVRDNAGSPSKTSPTTRGCTVTQIHRYEAGTAAPTLDVLRNLAIARHVSTDSLVVVEDDRAPAGDLRLAFEPTHDLDPDEQAMVHSLIEAVLLEHQAKRWAA